ncbi:hypothetical protein [Pyrobaculum sp.]|uniref:hypothetical protein n=1 Tax=Pyrobaculum sp. TaxID=2004705 RepID=UPI003D14E446
MRREDSGILNYVDKLDSINVSAVLVNPIFGAWLVTWLSFTPRTSPRDRELNTVTSLVAEVARSSFIKLSWSHYFVEKNENIKVTIDRQQVWRKGFVKVRIFGVGSSDFIVV